MEAQGSHCLSYLEQNSSTRQNLVPHFAPLNVIAASTVVKVQQVLMMMMVMTRGNMSASVLLFCIDIFIARQVFACLSQLPPHQQRRGVRLLLFYPLRGHDDVSDDGAFIYSPPQVSHSN